MTYFQATLTGPRFTCKDDDNTRRHLPPLTEHLRHCSQEQGKRAQRIAGTSMSARQWRVDQGEYKIRPCLVSTLKLYVLSYQMFGHMHEVLNID
jgi:hypothetical protein